MGSNDVKIKCIKTFLPFICGNEYYADSRLFTNKDDDTDSLILTIESKTEDDLENCYPIPYNIFFNHFVQI